MKKIVFIMSHIGSNVGEFGQILNNNDRICVYNTNLTYNCPTMLESLGNNHKMKNSSAIYADIILYNHLFSCKQLYKLCKFIFLIQNPRSSIIGLREKFNDTSSLVNYYKFRVRRIYEIIKETDGIFLTNDDIINKDCYLKIENYLDLKQSLDFNEKINFKYDTIDYKCLKEMEDCYEYYLFKIKNLNK